MADFTKIDQTVNAALDNQGTPTPAAAPATPPIEQTPIPPSELEQLRAEVAQLRSEAALKEITRQDELSAQRLKTAGALANQPVARLATGQQDIEIQKAISAVGGNFRWHQLSPAQRAEALGVSGADTKLSVVKQYFGSGSDSGAANRLAMQNPAEYKRLRALAKVNGVI